MLITPEASNKPTLTSAEIEELVIGKWTGDSVFLEKPLSISFHSDHTCEAIYDSVIYTGTWKMGSRYNQIDFQWETDLKVPSAVFEDQYSSVISADYSNGYICTVSSYVLDKN